MLAWKLGYQANCWGALGGDGVGVTSVKNLFYRTFGGSSVLRRSPRRLGVSTLVVGGGAQRASGVRDKDYLRLADSLEKVCRIAERRGLDAHFHPHLTAIAETPEQIERVFSLTAIKFCPDMAHLVAGGCDPSEMIRRYSDRITYVHLKDFRRDPFAFLPFGEGDLDMAGIVRTLVDANFEVWVSVELDSHPNPKEAAKTSACFLAGEMGKHAVSGSKI